MRKGGLQVKGDRLTIYLQHKHESTFGHQKIETWHTISFLRLLVQCLGKEVDVSCVTF
jgi:hypothetical protein